MEFDLLIFATIIALIVAKPFRDLVRWLESRFGSFASVAVQWPSPLLTVSGQLSFVR
jgi:hypothetical protein